MERFARRLIALAATRLPVKLRAKTDPEDVVQSVFKSFFARQAEAQFTLDSWDSLWTLLTVITLRKCGRWSEHYHTGRRRVEAEVALGPPPGASSSGLEMLADEPTPSEAAMLTEMVEDLLKQLSGQ